ncbi:hypothetical protein INS49_005418 [Diaporthe citri]|uniref:uncharacterized protein n=1 Tax=Diaporthe citri TaxID=83186 RepID=UPI001C801B06|nr:uncharacterized protein INS49_005418 [Diaporthe citri]KAG6353709.1 hypothetical protein INS49_005418 [Diaporthe citri]
MSSNATYDFVVPIFIKGLTTYDHILSKAEAYAKEKGVDVDATFFEARLVDDQLPLNFQVQITAKIAQINLGRLTGQEITPFEADEKTVAGLRKVVQKTLDLLKSADASKAAGREEATVDLPALGKTHKSTVKAAVVNHGLPNFYFHLVTGYSIIRARGVQVGKADYLSSFLGF